VDGRSEPQDLESRRLESRPKTEARLVLEVSAGWASPSSRGISGEGLCVFTGAGNPNPLTLPHRRSSLAFSSRSAR
jgi:hypothetical protein